MSKPSAPSIGFHFRLYVGAPPGSGKLGVTERFEIFQRVACYFPGFFSYEGQGFFEGDWEDCLCVEVATIKPMDLLELARDLREALNLVAVGVSWSGIYQRVLADSDLDEILGRWKLPELPA